MKPSVLMETIASNLYALSGNDRSGKKIDVRFGYNNELRASSSLEIGACPNEHSSGHLVLYPPTITELCKSDGVCALSDLTDDFECDRDVEVTQLEYSAAFDLQAFRCGSMDLLHLIRQSLSASGCGHTFHKDINFVKVTGTIFDISSIATGDEWEDRAQTTLTVEFIDRAVCEIPCATLCMDTVIKPK